MQLSHVPWTYWMPPAVPHAQGTVRPTKVRQLCVASTSRNCSKLHAHRICYELMQRPRGEEQTQWQRLMLIEEGRREAADFKFAVVRLPNMKERRLTAKDHITDYDASFESLSCLDAILSGSLSGADAGLRSRSDNPPQ